MTIIFSNAGDEDCQILRNIWAGIDGAKVVEVTLELEEDLGVSGLNKLVDEAVAAEDDFVVFCGHGGPSGLCSPSFGTCLFSSRNMHLVHAPKVLCIWCYASEFCKSNGFGCLTSSMYISNSREAYWNGFRDVPQEYINCTNEATFKEMNEMVKNGTPLQEWPELLMGTLDFSNPIDAFNRAGMMYID